MFCFAYTACMFRVSRAFCPLSQRVLPRYGTIIAYANDSIFFLNIFFVNLCSFFILPAKYYNRFFVILQSFLWRDIDAVTRHSCPATESGKNGGISIKNAATYQQKSNFLKFFLSLSRQTLTNSDNPKNTRIFDQMRKFALLRERVSCPPKPWRRRISKRKLLRGTTNELLATCDCCSPSDLLTCL